MTTPNPTYPEPDQRPKCKHCGEPLERVERWVHRFYEIRPGERMSVHNSYDHFPERDKDV